MNKVIIAAAVVLASAFASANTKVVDVEKIVSINGAFIPGGFDSQSDAYVVVNGLFPNGCYNWSRAEVKRDGNVHEVRSMANVNQGMCIMVMVPFTREIALGRLAVGDHKIRFMNGDGTYLEKPLNIEE